MGRPYVRGTDALTTEEARTGPGADPGAFADWERYQLGDIFADPVEVGRGGFGVVYRARELALRRTVAIKVLGQIHLDPKAEDRFTRELQAMGALADHPHIVTVYTFGRSPTGYAYLVMAYLPGGSLAQRLGDGGVFTWHETVDIGVKLAGALETAHGAGILHRDIKPENVLISSFGEPSLGDFGIARIAGGVETKSGTITASLAHAPPEVLDGARPDERADVYSLASTLFALLNGGAAFADATDESIMPMLARILTKPLPDLTNRGVPGDVFAALAGGMERSPERRFPSALAFGQALQQAQAMHGHPVTPLHVGIHDGDVTGPIVAPDTGVIRTGDRSLATADAIVGAAAIAAAAVPPVPVVDAPAAATDVLGASLGVAAASAVGDTVAADASAVGMGLAADTAAVAYAAGATDVVPPLAPPSGETDGSVPADTADQGFTASLLGAGAAGAAVGGAGDTNPFGAPGSAGAVGLAEAPTAPGSHGAGGTRPPGTPTPTPRRRRGIIFLVLLLLLIPVGGGIVWATVLRSSDTTAQSEEPTAASQATSSEAASEEPSAEPSPTETASEPAQPPTEPPEPTEDATRPEGPVIVVRTPTPTPDPPPPAPPPPAPPPAAPPPAAPPPPAPPPPAPQPPPPAPPPPAPPPPAPPPPAPPPPAPPPPAPPPPAPPPPPPGPPPPCGDC